MKRQGFTMLELTVVIGAIGVMAAMLLPALARSREAARRTSCANNMHQIGLAFNMYAHEHERALPWSGGGQNPDFLPALLGGYLPSKEIFVCPSDATMSPRDWTDEEGDPVVVTEHPVLGIPSLRASYDFLAAYTAEPLHLPHPSRTMPAGLPLAWDVGSGITQSRSVRRRALAEQVIAEGDFDEAEVEALNQAGNAFNATSMNHVPVGGVVLWMDGSIAFVKAQDWVDANQPTRVPAHTDTFALNWPTLPPDRRRDYRPDDPDPPLVHMPAALREAVEALRR